MLIIGIKVQITKPHVTMKAHKAAQTKIIKDVYSYCLKAVPPR